MIKQVSGMTASAFTVFMVKVDMTIRSRYLSFINHHCEKSVHILSFSGSYFSKTKMFLPKFIRSTCTRQKPF